MNIKQGKLLAIKSGSRFRMLWDISILAVSVGITILLPVIVVFDVSLKTWHLVLDSCLSLLFLADIAIKIIADRNNLPSMEKNRIMAPYKRGIFVFDCIAAFPSLTLAFLISTIFTHRAFQFLILLRLVKLFVSSSVLRHIRSTRLNPAVLRLAHLVFWILIAAHLVSCGWILIDGPGRYFSGDHSSSPVIYMEAFYWTVTTLTTVGYGDITPSNPVQFLYVIVVMLMGAAIYGFIIGNIANIIARIDVTKSKFREKVDTIETFLKYKDIPTDLQIRIHDYYEYLWRNHRGYEESRLFSDLPPGLKNRLASVLNRDIMEKIPLFRNASEVLKREMVVNLRPVVYTPGDIIIYYGEIGHEMYFIGRGEVDVTNRDGSILYNTLTTGQFFGEIALLLSTPRTATVRARSYCDIYVLDRKTFNNVAEHYPEFARAMDELAEIRRKELGLDYSDSGT